MDTQITEAVLNKLGFKREGYLIQLNDVVVSCAGDKGYSVYKKGQRDNLTIIKTVSQLQGWYLHYTGHELFIDNL